MACDLTRGRIVDCKDQVGGLRRIWFAKDYSNNILVAATLSGDEITTAGFANWSGADTSVMTFFQYDLRRDLSSLTVNTNSDQATGTTSYEQVLEINLQKLTKEDSAELRLIAYNRPQVIVEDNNGNLFLLGAENGLDVSAGVMQTGTAHTDMSGYTMTLTGREKRAVLWLAASGGQGTTDFPFDGLADANTDYTVTVGS